MRAKFIYEKFTEDSDPITDMGIGLVGRYLCIPDGWVRSETNKLYKRYRSKGPYDESDYYKVIKAEIEYGMIRVTLEQKFGIGITIIPNLLLTPRQFKMFAKKYQNKK